MTKADLLSYARMRLDDTVQPYLWSDAELTRYLEDAESEAAERARLLVVSGVAEYCAITLEEGTASYELDPLVFWVEKARVSSERYPLTRTSRERMDADFLNWEDDSGTPERFFVEDGTITFHPVPAGAGTANMTVCRLPVSPMGTSPEIHARHHMRLLDWVMRQAFMKRDSDTFDEKRAMLHESLFERSFGKKWDAEQQRRQRRRMPTVMKDNPYLGGE
jgi:hypothetical protein